jgi:nucleobase:cation symporter-1, NCS1 family
VGANIPAVLRALVACGWFGIQSWIGGAAIYQIIGAMGWFNIAGDTIVVPFLGITLASSLCFLAFWALNVVIVLRGISSDQVARGVRGALPAGVGVALLVWALVKVDSVKALFDQPSRFETRGQFWRGLLPAAHRDGGLLGDAEPEHPGLHALLPLAADQAAGQLIGLPTTMTLFCFIGVVVTSRDGDDLRRGDLGPGRAGAQTGGAGGGGALADRADGRDALDKPRGERRQPGQRLLEHRPSRISFRTGAVITCLIGVVIMPWRLYNDLGAYIFTWLIGYSALLGPIAGIMLADYYIMRRTRLNAAALYDPAGEYAGVNWRAVAAFVVAVAPNLPGFVNAATGKALFPVFFDRIYGYAWFVGLFLSALLYCVLMWGRARPAPEAVAEPVFDPAKESSS